MVSLTTWLSKAWEKPGVEADSVLKFGQHNVSHECETLRV